MNERVLTLGHSPDPDDAFMFYGLAKGLIPTPGYRFEHILQDIQTLNERATRGELDISAISLHAYAYVADTYALLPSGASMGDGYGPMLVARGGTDADEIAALPHRRARHDDQRVSGARSSGWNVAPINSRASSCRSTRSSPRSRRAGPTSA